MLHLCIREPAYRSRGFPITVTWWVSIKLFLQVQLGVVYFYFCLKGLGGFFPFKAAWQVRWPMCVKPVGQINVATINNSASSKKLTLKFLGVREDLTFFEHICLIFNCNTFFIIEGYLENEGLWGPHQVLGCFSIAYFLFLLLFYETGSR